VSPPGGLHGPEDKAREKIDAALVASGWIVQDREDMNLTAGRGVAVREFKARKYSEGLPAKLPARLRPLPFLASYRGP
jgi:hypothetical protein